MAGPRAGRTHHITTIILVLFLVLARLGGPLLAIGDSF